MDVVQGIADKIIEASTKLSADKKKALEKAIETEEGNARWALEQILENYNVAEDKKFPLCDDTGIPHVIAEIGRDRILSGELISQISDGIQSGLNQLPARPMAVKGNRIERIEQSKGLFSNPSMLAQTPILIDSFNDRSTYSHEISDDTLNIHLILQGGGPEIRSKTYRVYHKRSFENVINTAVEWLKNSLKMLGCTPSIPSIGIGRTHYEASCLMLKSMVYGNLDNQNSEEIYVTEKLNESSIGPLGFGGKHTVLGSFVNIGNQRASGVRIVSVRPSCFVEPRVATLKL